MSNPVTMSFEQYNLLLDFAYGRNTKVADLRDLQAKIDRANRIKRYFLNIRWYERGGSAPSRIELRDLGSWPPTQDYLLRQDRPITRDDVDQVLRNIAKNPVLDAVTVTADVRGIVGWTELESWDFNLNV